MKKITVFLATCFLLIACGSESSSGYRLEFSGVTSVRNENNPDVWFEIDPAREEPWIRTSVIKGSIACYDEFDERVYSHSKDVTFEFNEYAWLVKDFALKKAAIQQGNFLYCMVSDLRVKQRE